MVMWKIPAVVVAFLSWWTAPPASLADAARREGLRRQALPHATRAYTNQDLPVAPPPPDTPPDVAAGEPPPETAAGAAGAKDKDKEEKHDEAWWRARMSAATSALARDQGLAEAMQSRINGLTTDWTNRDDPAQKAVLFEQRQRALAELDRLKLAIVADQDAIDGIREDARRQGVPPGWIRIS
jgi:hypothetical protein